MPKKTEPMSVITVKEEHYKKLKKIANLRNMSIRELVEEIFINALKKPEEEPKCDCGGDIDGNHLVGCPFYKYD